MGFHCVHPQTQGSEPRMVQASRFLRLTTPDMRGPDVMAVQRRLIALGVLSGGFDGEYNSQTRAAVIAFQRASGIRADGIVGPETWMALGLDQVAWGRAVPSGGRHHEQPAVRVSERPSD
ncbi:hypothetical protein GCM10025857_11500 [Alicyclobacillus contaminans]|nr:hypothetical protein GCM10025857_11500 [Alicyclobacillus contaminans]